MLSFHVKILKLYFLYIQGILRVIMNPMELKIQPTIHFQRKDGYFISLEMYCGLHFQFRRAHYHS
jgi:hypothetical protein